MPTIKIKELETPCRNQEHLAPMYMVYEPGQYRHICPECGKSYEFTEPGQTKPSYAGTVFQSSQVLVKDTIGE